MRILIVEDEAAAARRLIRIIKELEPAVEISDVFETISDTVTWLQINASPDLILMDIHLADGSCFEIFRQIEVKSPVIFITAYDQYAIQAFKVNSLDYLLKPVKKEELEQSLKKWKNRDSNPNLQYLIEQMLSKTKEQPRRFVVKYGQFLKAIDASDAALFYAEDKNVLLQTFDNQSFPIDFTLDKLENILDPAIFYRISRGVIINYNAIGQMYTHFKGRIKIDPTVKCPVETYVSTERTSDFKLWLAGR